MSAYVSAEEAAILHRAGVVAVPGEWIGFFELLIACRMLNITILLVFGSFICDVNAVFGAGLPEYVSLGTYSVVGVKTEKHDDTVRDLSACRPGSHHVDVNHFVIGTPFDGPSGKITELINLTGELTYTGPARRAADFVHEQVLRFRSMGRGVGRWVEWEGVRKKVRGGGCC